MTEREHSRSGAASGQGARSGAGNLRAGEDEGDERQAFAGKGQFTGRPISTQDVDANPADTSTPGADHLELLESERNQFREDLQRLAADFENFRRRAQREREQAAAAADAKLLEELLAVLDDFERALEHSVDGGDDQLVDGIRMVHARLWSVLEQHGLTEIDASGEFDPHLHDAVMSQPAPDGVAANTVLQVVQKGYMLGERPLRHAKVIVAAE